MAVTEVNMIETQFKYSLDQIHKRVNVYECISDDKFEDPKAVLDAVSDKYLERRGFKVEWRWGDDNIQPGSAKTDSASMLIDADVRFRSVKESRWLWRATLTFESWAMSQSDNKREDSYEQGALLPWEQAPVWTGGFFHVEEEAKVDVNGKRVANTADQPYEGIYIDKAYDTIICEYNTEVIDYDQRAQYVNTINNAEFWGYPVKAVKLKDWSYEIRYHGRDTTDPTKGKAYVVNRFEFHIKDDDIGWPLKLVNWGTATKPSGQDDPYEVIEMPTRSGAKIPFTPLILAMDGASVEDPQPSTTDDHLNEFEFYKAKDFTQLPPAADGHAPPARKPAGP